MLHGANIVCLEVSIFDTSLTLEYYREIFDSEVYVTILGRTISMSVFVATASTILGYPATFFSRQGRKTNAHFG